MKVDVTRRSRVLSVTAWPRMHANRQLPPLPERLRVQFEKGALESRERRRRFDGANRSAHVARHYRRGETAPGSRFVRSPDVDAHNRVAGFCAGLGPRLCFRLTLFEPASS